ncbi:MAG: hypothetical protein A2846_01075 [Candidatus Doudnabacteria bacterium RIFCSPHIGHO2_01_FULL_49_9]|uniref:Uncharacterized protein n=1 Tax=Candidatus Doudnabacteria bacterium RIFCSPHIGHO2_01_FULL_49_9 TaxID=1817827 RepID=A0A1F5P3G2_9BACT|nr:MAG: hypothetical protein A2846_01075 [Candidatus Doudnabacteria bacterium RIFCSPHIGHO2_01_FULL_49_9]
MRPKNMKKTIPKNTPAIMSFLRIPFTRQNRRSMLPAKAKNLRAREAFERPRCRKDGGVYEFFQPRR